MANSAGPPAGERTADADAPPFVVAKV